MSVEPLQGRTVGGSGERFSFEWERGVIVGQLDRVRREWWAVRLAERVTLGIAYGAAVAIFMIAARWVWTRWPWMAVMIAVAAIGGACWIALGLRRRERVRGYAGLLMLGAVVTTVVMAAGMTMLAWPVHVEGWMYAAGTVAVFAVAGAMTVRRATSREAAVLLDQQAGLHEQVATALEVLERAEGDRNGNGSSIFDGAVVAGASAACAEARTVRLRYGRFDRRLYAVAATGLIAAMGIAELTPLPALGRPAERSYVVVAEKAKKLDAVLAELAEKSATTQGGQSQLKPLQETLAQLKKGNTSAFEAEARLGEERAELQKEQDALDASHKAEEALQGEQALQDLARASDNLKEAGTEQASAKRAAEQAAREAVQAAAKGVGDKVSKAGAGGAEQGKLADKLEKAADAAKGDPQLQSSLKAAAADARQGDGQKMSQDLGAAGERMGEQGAQRQLTGESLRQAMEAIDRSSDNGMGGDEAKAQDKGDGNGQKQEQSGGGSDGQQANSGQDGQQQQSGGQQGQQGGGGSQDQQGQQGQQSQSGGQQAGGSGSGAGQQASAGTGSGGQEQGQGGGSTNFHAPSGPGDHNAGKPLGGTQDFVRIYDEKKIASTGSTDKVSGKIDPLAPAAGTMNVFGKADRSDSTIQTYESQLPAARKRAMDDLQSQDIPPQYRDLIRNYYDK